MTALPVAPETRVNTYAQNFQRSPVIASDNQGNYIVVWTSGADLRFGPSTTPSPDGSVSGVYAQRFQADGTPLGSEFQVNTYTQDAQDINAVAMDDQGNFIITWSSRGQDGSGNGVYAQRYQADGTPAGSEFRVNTFTTGNQDSSDVAIDANGNFIVTWSSFNQDGSGLGVFAQRYQADGTPLGNEFQVNTISDGQQGIPAIATDASGSFVISWTSIAPSGEYDIYARRFDANGSPVQTPSGNTAEIRVNSFQAGQQEFSDVAMAPNGDFIITWQSLALSGDVTSGRDNSSYGIFAQRYRADGTAVGSEFQVNTTEAESQYRPSIAVDPDGNFVITWDSWNQDGSLGSIVAQHYRADGTPWGGEALVNTITEGVQTNPAVAMAGNRDFIVAWDSAENTLSGQPRTIDIYARRFDTPSPPIIGTPLDDVLIGDDGFNRISGLAGNDTLQGLGGVDALEGGDGDDTLEGGDGQDSLFGQAGNDQMKGGTGPDTLVGGDGDDTMLGDADNDYLQGNDGHDVMNGGGGDDVLDSGSGNDVLDGGEGGDRMFGGPGYDTYYINNVRDKISEAKDGAIDAVYSSLPTYTLPGNIEILILNHDQAKYGIGNAGRNRLTGNRNHNILEGREDIDEIYGLAGNDKLYGNEGSDSLSGGDDHDVLKGGEGHDFLIGGTGDDRIYGGTQNDHIYGDLRFSGLGGNDKLRGESGDDVLIGSALGAGVQRSGNNIDKLIGGSGADHFVLGYRDRAAYEDTKKRQGKGHYARIWDFEIGEDFIHLAEGEYVLKNLSSRSLKGTGIFLEKDINGSTSRDLVGLVRGIHPNTLDINDETQFVIGNRRLPETANFDHFG